MRIGVRFPGIDENRIRVGERRNCVPDSELRVGALNLEQDMAMRVRVTHQLPVHIEQGDAAEYAMGHAKSVGHRNSPETASEED
jgi:hypothetical protein